ncbi:MAG: hypothetical protein KC431_14750, partial [Myxococcales bacterium]|nr:hypothetical protein [Myxococcales bacterium]
NRYIEDVAQDSVRLVLALVWGSITITATQRRSAADVLKRKGSRAVVLTDSRISRGVLTAVSWLGGNIQGYPWSQLEQAVEDAGGESETKVKLRDVSRKYYQSVQGTDEGES